MIDIVKQPRPELSSIINEKLSRTTAEETIAWAVRHYGHGLMMSTSFGIQSAVTLHLVTENNPEIPIIWIDTGYLPQETYQYAETLSARLNLNLKVYRSELEPNAMEDLLGRLWANNSVDEMELYDWIRKVEPMQRALQEWQPTGWISGLRAEQTAYRKNLPVVQRTPQYDKIHPILSWTNKEIYDYMERHGLPQHPLWEQGYTTVGDWHSSRPRSAKDQDDRVTRFGGLKQECGLHPML